MKVIAPSQTMPAMLEPVPAFRPFKLRHRASLSLPFFAFALALAPTAAHAGGFEYGYPGARSLGRGGADTAGIDTPLALFYNPANLARMNRFRATLDVNLGIYDICMRREYVFNGPDSDYRPTAEVPLIGAPDEDGRRFFRQICNSGRPTIVPNLGVAIPIVDGLTLGAGIIVPVSSQVQNFGRADGTYLVGPDDFPTPTRYIITKQDLLQLFGTVGVGYAPIDELRFGFAFGWGYTHARFVNVAHARLDPNSVNGVDTPNYLDAKDKFMPRVTVSAATTPVPGLDIAASFTWVSNVEAHGPLQVGFAGQRLPLPTQDPINVDLVAPQPWTFNLGIRFADRLPEPVGTVGDRLSTERWDIEMDLGIVGSSRVQAFDVDIPDEASISNGAIHLPNSLSIPHRWKNQYTARLGGDFNPIPNVLGLRAGLSFESSGVTHGFEQIDFLPFRRVGIHLGGTVRIADRFDVSVAYAHLFQETTDVRGSYCAASTENCLNRAVASDPPQESELIPANAGIINSSVNLISLQMDMAF